MGVNRNKSEMSFTLLETIIAIGLLVTVVLEVSTVQGNAVNFSTYERKVTQAIWLAKGVMADIEYKSKNFPLQEIKDTELKDQEFGEVLCPKEAEFGCDYKYNLTIKNWKLPLVSLLFGGLLGGGGGDGEDEDPITTMIKGRVKEILGDEVLKVVHVEVTWADGVRQDSVEMAYLLVNQIKLDEQIEQLEPIKNKDKKSDDKSRKVLQDNKFVPEDSLNPF